ncbi:hypothetical protein QFC22_005885 [Naganishia vaughanmartiniae]|uniref:Uncharacterized protein n=1 Tax=Naganishia vaughanmartiniae TaxID=1424756 RepID=A0ACC2WRX2_9TREE|nr:hypothetical protein QFC22_005885 [Naganishia vaughanmartiniae]
MVTLLDSTPPPKPNLALKVTPDHRIYIDEIPYPTARPDEAIVHVKATGICGSDVKFWKSGGIGDYTITSDLILGHESSGIVLSVGSDVTTLKPGDRVSVEPGVSCAACGHCKTGRYNLCPDVRFCGTPPTHGTLARYIAHKASYLFKIPDTMPFATAALVEPISVALGGIQRANVVFGQPILICGAGPIGLNALAIARAAGAYPILVTDIAQHKLDRARGMGADLTLRCSLEWDGKEVARRVREAFGKIEVGLEPEVALECTGAQTSFYGAGYSLRAGGVLMEIGNGHNEQMIPFQTLSMREIDVRFLFRYVNTWPMVIRMLSAGKLQGVERMITHTFNLEDSVAAFEEAADASSGAVKVQIVDDR